MLILRSSKGLVVPSSTEALGLAVLEARAFQKPVVVWPELSWMEGVSVVGGVDIDEIFE